MLLLLEREKNEFLMKKCGIVSPADSRGYIAAGLGENEVYIYLIKSNLIFIFASTGHLFKQYTIFSSFS